MNLQVAIKRDCYQDSVRLMQITDQVKALPGVIRAAAIMGTESNKLTLERAGFDMVLMAQARPNDVLFLVEGEDESLVKAALSRFQAMLDEQVNRSGSDDGPRSAGSAGLVLSGANLALISVPGQYAAYEASKALRAGMSVQIFSDNVSVEQEVRLKKLGQRLGLLVMGPDCGTSIIGGVPLGFANAVARGPVGIVGASGTGIQQLSVLIDRLGSGISHAIGVGGRDLSDAVGGLSAGIALDMLAADEQTKVIILVSKPPGERTGKSLIEKVRQYAKPVVIAFLGGDPSIVAQEKHVAANLEQAAAMAVALAAGEIASADFGAGSSEQLSDRDALFNLARGKPGSRKYLRGLFTGGSLADEAMLVLERRLGHIYSNTHFDQALRVAGVRKGSGHTVIDFGDDEFTQGRPHPMIDPSYRAERLAAEWADPEVAVILCDVVLGYGSHHDPAGVLADSVRLARSLNGDEVTVIASVCGTEGDPQVLSVQQTALREAGVLVFPTNALAAAAAGLIALHCCERGSFR